MYNQRPLGAISLVLAALLAACGGGGKSGEDTDTDSPEDTPVDTSGDSSQDTDEDGEPPCTSDSDCDDGMFCNGQETCNADGSCRPGTSVDCSDDNPCTMDACDEGTGACDNEPLDADGDGFVAMESPGGFACEGEDCDDTAADIYPGAPEVECDLVDKDCDGAIDEHIDSDADGWIDIECDGIITDPGDSFEGLGDCDDESEHVYPGAPEGCDGAVDNDCDGDALEIDADFDEDGHADRSCEGGDDCDDSDPDIHPDATEVCDLVDDDCDDSIFDAAGIDDDSDGVPDASCGGNDCDDDDATIHGAFDPTTASDWVTDDAQAAATEACDTVDQDCDGQVLDAPGADDDSDDVLDVGCGGTDCNDLNPAVYPGAPENECDSTDNDCDGDAIDGIADDDDDDYLDDACASGTDCDDTDPDVHPGASPVCDTVDDDCSGSWGDELGADDDGDTVLDEACGGPDCDDDDAGAHPGASRACGNDHDCDGRLDDDSDLDGHVWDACGGDDCNDGVASIYGGAPIVPCSTVDNDCNGNADRDNDGDGARDIVCTGGTDCDDADPTRFPGAPAVCDMVDNDCSGAWWDEAGADSDGDRVLDAACGGDDCDDTDPLTYLDAPEVCNDGTDQDCDTLVDLPVDGVSPVEVDCCYMYTPSGARPAIAWSGTEFGIVWTRDSSSTLHMNRVLPDGTKIGSTIDIPGSSYGEYLPDLVWSGSEYALAHGHYDAGSNRIAFSRLAANGSRVGSAVNIGLGNGAPAIVWTGSEYGMSWDNGSNVLLARVSPTGTVIGSVITVAGANYRDSDLAWTGSEFAMVFGRTGYPYIIALRRISATGTPVGTTINISPGLNDYAPSIEWTGSELVVTYSGSGGSTLQRLSPSGVDLGSTAALGDTGAPPPCAAWSGLYLGLAYTSGALSFATLDGAGTSVASDVVLLPTITAQHWMRMTPYDDGIGMAWYEDDAWNTGGIYFVAIELCQ